MLWKVSGSLRAQNTTRVTARRLGQITYRMGSGINVVDVPIRWIVHTEPPNRIPEDQFDWVHYNARRENTWEFTIQNDGGWFTASDIE